MALDLSPAILKRPDGRKMSRLRVVVDDDRVRAWAQTAALGPNLVLDEPLTEPLRRGARGGYEAVTAAGTFLVKKGGSGCAPCGFSLGKVPLGELPT